MFFSRYKYLAGPLCVKSLSEFKYLKIELQKNSNYSPLLIAKHSQCDFNDRKH